MAQQEYEQKRAECWEEFIRANPSHNKSIFARKVFDFAFDRAYALGREKETITQEEIRKAAVEYAEENMWYPGETSYESDINDMTESFADAFESGANFALSKQEKDADTVIQGWVAIDEAFNQCFLHTEKPIQKAQSIADTGDYDTVWDSKGKTYLLDTGLFPDMDSDSDPIEVELIIKRKKK